MAVKMPARIKLTMTQTENLKDGLKLMEHLHSELSRAKRSGMDVDQKLNDLAVKKANVEGILREFV